MRKLFVFLVVIIVPLYFAIAGSVERVSVSTLNVQGNNDSYGGEPSADGRYITFISNASNLVLGDTNGDPDVFVYDRDTDTIERVSVDSNGVEGNGGTSANSSISADGRYVAFDSEADNLVPDDTNGLPDIFVHDRTTGDTERVSIDNDGIEADQGAYLSAISADGRYVALSSDASNLLGTDGIDDDTNGLTDIFVYDRDTDTIERVSVDDGGVEATDGSSGQFGLEISDDGRYVVFDSDATTLVAGDTNGLIDIFVYDRDTDTIERVSVDSNGVEANGGTSSPSISGDGRYTTFISLATNLVSSDTNAAFDVFVHDSQADTTERVSVSSNGDEANNGSVFAPTLSTDGRYAIFASLATNLVSGDTNGVADVFVHDRTTGETERVSVNADGEEANALSIYKSTITEDGRYVIFPSNASNLVPNDTNAKIDVFVYDRQEEDVDEISESGNSYGFRRPNIKIKDDATETTSRFVDVEAIAPGNISYFEISNTADFSVKETYVREYTQKDLYWDLCKGFIGCGPGMKRIYARFYNDNVGVFEDYVDINYIGKQCPYFKQFLRKGYKNDIEEVAKAQEFLNQEIKAGLVIDGIFGDKTDGAVRLFQAKYPTEIIFPWPTLKSSTGFWYITTTAYANMLVGC